MRSDELFNVDDATLRREYEEQIAPHMGLSAVAIQMEQQRRATLQMTEAMERVRAITAELAEATKRLERLTVGLFVLTVLVLFAALPPAIEIASKLLGYDAHTASSKPLTKGAGSASNVSHP